MILGPPVCDVASAPGSSRLSRGGRSFRPTRRAPRRRRGGLARLRWAEKIGDFEQDRCRGEPAAMARHRCTVGPPGPHPDRHFPVVADRPEIAEAVGRSGLEGEPAAAADLGWQHVGRRWRLGQDVIDVPRGERAEDRRARDHRVILAIAQRRDFPAIRQRRIELHQVGQSDTDAAERHRETGLDGRLGQAQPDPRSGEGANEPARPDPVEHGDRREVKRILQRLPRRHLAFESSVEIARGVIPKMPRAVLQHGLRVDDQPVEAHRVDERFERRSRRAHGARHVEGPPARRRSGIGIADIGAHPAIAVVDDDRGEASLRFEPRGFAL